MPVPYPYATDLNFTNGLTGMFTYINAVTFGWFSRSILIATYLIFAIGFSFYRASSGNNDIQGGMAIGGFATLVIGTMFWIAGIVDVYTFGFVIIMAIVGFVALFVGDN